MSRARAWLAAGGGLLPQPLAFAELTAALDEAGLADRAERQAWIGLLQAADAGFLEGWMAKGRAKEREGG